MEEKRIPSGGVSRNLTRCGSCAVGGRITDGFPRLQRLSPLPATMANASAKKTAASNERAIQNLRQGLLVASTLSMFIRIIFRTKSLSPAQVSFWLHILSHIPSTFIARYLYKIGEPRRTDTGELISPGEDLNQPGVIEWCFDIIYVTCKHVPNSPGIMFQAVHCRGVPNRERNIWGKVLGVSRGRKPYLLSISPYSVQFTADTPQIPLYALYKIWTSFLGPYLGFGKSSDSTADAEENAPQQTSKRQEKLKKRSERGDPRVQTKTVKKQQ